MRSTSTSAPTSASTRFAIKRSLLWRPLLTLFGASADRSWIELGAHEFRVRFGWVRLVIPRTQIRAIEPATWPWWGGIGWRTDFYRNVGLIGASSPVVRIDFTTRQGYRRLGLPVRFTELYISVEEPEQVINAVQQWLREDAERQATSA